MYILLYLSVLACCYVGTFKSDFKDEDIRKAVPLLVIALLISIISVIAGGD